MKSIKNLFLLLLLSSIKFTFSQDINIFFKTDSFEINSSNAELLINFLKANEIDKNKYRFEIIGHTDNEGDFAYNKTLSYKRALKTKNFLFYNGIDTTNTILRAEGEYKPISTNLTESGKSLNRRVSINISPWNQRLSYLLPDSLVIEEYDFHSQDGYEKKINECCVIKFKPNAFADSIGKEIYGKIKLKITYFNNAESIITTGISMQSSINDMDILYKSHLMFKIEAFYNGKLLNTVYENYVTIDCNCVEKYNDSELFSFENGDWKIIPKNSKETNDESNKSTTNDNSKTEITPPASKNNPNPAIGGGNGKIKKDTCIKIHTNCACVDLLAGNEKYNNVTKKDELSWAFKPIYPNKIDSITDYNEMYKSLDFTRKGYNTKYVYNSKDLNIKVSISKKGFFFKKQYLKIKTSNSKDFPELKPIQKYSWVINKSSIYYNNSLKKKTFSDIRIYKKEKNNYILELKTNDSIITFNVSGDKKLNADDYLKYESILNTLSIKVSDSLKKDLKRKDREYADYWCQVWHCYKIIMPEEQKALSYDNWRFYTKTHKNEF